MPLGLFLSGGVDSSAIAMAAAARSPASLQAFTIGFQESTFDERQYAKQMAEHAGIRYCEEVLTSERAIELGTSVLGRIDEPSGDPSIIPTYLLSRFTRQHVTVALSGDGGDELFAGYDPFKALLPASLYAKLMPSPVHKGLRGIVEKMPTSSSNMSLDFVLKRTLLGLSYPDEMRNPAWLSLLEPALLEQLFGQALPQDELYSEAIELWEQGGNKSVMDKSLEFYGRYFLPDRILSKVDQATMMCSLESRAVFLDNEIVEFCQRLPHRMKFRHGSGKYVLKRALKGMVPENILNRRKKGFGIPLTDWLPKLIGPALPSTPVIRDEFARRLFRNHMDGREDQRLALWGILSLGTYLSNRV